MPSFLPDEQPESLSVHDTRQLGEVRWTPKQRRSLILWKRLFWTDNRFADERRMLFNDRRLDFARWLIEQRIVTDWPAGSAPWTPLSTALADDDVQLPAVTVAIPQLLPD